MSAHDLNHQLAVIGRQLNGWQAWLRGACWAAAVLGAVWLFSLTDLWLQFGLAGRVVTWVIVLALAAVGAWQVLAAWRMRQTPESVAARIERAFPHLDNHLINFVQFARQANGDRLTASYLQRDIPGWTTLDLQLLRDRRRHRHANLALVGTVILLVLPALWAGRAWSNSLVRVLNPFANRAASTLAQFVAVTPGNTSLVAGQPLTLVCRVEGKAGQEVWLDLQPADDKDSTVKVGVIGQPEAALTKRGYSDEPAVAAIDNRGDEFSYALPKVAGNLKYRFRVGDARSARYQVTVVPPLALASLSVTVTPPAYTKLAARTFDGLGEPVTAPQGSTLTVALLANRELATASVGGQPAALQNGKWVATAGIGASKSLVIFATTPVGEQLESELKLLLEPDRAPVIRVIAPQGRTALPPDSPARIQWVASDDYGLTRVVLEKENGDVVQEWNPGQAREFPGQWTGGIGLYRIAAYDATQRSQSSLLVFEAAKPKEIVAAQAQSASETAATLARLVKLQRDNRDQTIRLDNAGTVSTPAQWLAVGGAQATIRQLTGQLLADPRKPLGTLAGVVQDVHAGAMVEVLDVLDRAAKTGGEQRARYATRSIALESEILRVLTSAEKSYGQVEEHRQVTGLLALLDALVEAQENILKEAQAGATGLTSRQDRLAGDVNDFVQTARGEAQRLQRSDAEFAKLAGQVADGCVSRQVAPNMLRAAEKFEANATAAAVPFAAEALKALKEFQALLNQWRVAEAKEKMEEVRKVVGEAREKFKKLVDLQTKMVESLRQAVQSKDLSAADQKEFEEELAKLAENVKAGALKIADDLHIFPELPVGNELVQDISQIFEETKQVPGSDKTPADELGLQKEDFILDMMEKIDKRFDDMEMWLTAKPDATRRLTENFDQAEMPKMATIDMPKELQDIIGEMLEQQKDIEEKAHDSATNQAVPDLPMGWDIAEGEWSSFSAKGKSGNEAPDHKEQDGRSLVGRQGQADGETTAGSGKINKGDDKIENRRTQDPAQAGQVKEEEHTDAKATGGGKLSGFDDEFGMPGAGPRRDANLPGSPLGMQAQLRRNAEALYARASMLHIRTGSLDEVVRALRDAEDAVRDGRPIQQVRELQKRVTTAMQKAQADLANGISDTTIIATPVTPPGVDQLTGVPDEAPAQYRDLVAEYYKSLSGK